jgi:hypothetical protein
MVKDRIVKVVASDPDPQRFDIVSEHWYGQYVVVMLHYPDCTNYYGRKLLVYDNIAKWNGIKISGHIDPHFLDDRYSPIARFEPTPRGEILARQLAITLANEQNEN